MRKAQADRLHPRGVGEISGPGPWRRRIRRVRSRPLRDPLSQSVLALTSALLAGGLGLAVLATGRQAAGVVALCLASVAISFYAALALRALKRDKAVQFWMDCRDLRLELTRRDAHLDLRWNMLTLLRRLDCEGVAGGRPQEALATLVEDAFQVLHAASGQDIAVVLAIEANRRYRVLHASASRRSRWSVLSPGKHCPAEVPIEETLARLAPHHRMLGIDTKHGRLRMAVLSEAPFSKADLAFCDELPLYLILVAQRWAAAAPAGEPHLMALR